MVEEAHKQNTKEPRLTDPCPPYFPVSQSTLSSGQGRSDPAEDVRNAVHAAAHQLDANLVFEIADLAAEGRLRRVQPFLSRERQAAFLGDRDEIAKVP